MSNRTNGNNTMEKVGLFDILTNLNQGDKSPNLLKDATAESLLPPEPGSPEKVYSAFMINRGMSQHADTVLIANMMNRHSHLPVKMQYDFYRHLVRPRKRYGAWAKASKAEANIQLIMKKYNYNRDRAEEVIDLFSKADLKEIKNEMSEGGKM